MSSSRKKLRKALLELGDTICHYCTMECGEFFTVDHVIPTIKGGPNTIDNAVPACMWCNNAKHEMDYLDFLRSDFLQSRIEYVAKILSSP